MKAWQSQGKGHELLRSAMQAALRDRCKLAILTGRYDFTIRQTPPQPDENHVYSYSVSHLGLQVRAGTESPPRLVVDHIEKPSAN